MRQKNRKPKYRCFIERYLSHEEGTKVQVLAPVVREEKGTHKNLIEHLRKDGYLRAFIDGEMYDLDDSIKLSKK